MNSMAHDEYQCFSCSKRFRSRVFSITREWECVHFEYYLPEIEIENSCGLECYCSFECLSERRAEVMKREGVPIRRPGLEPIEICAKCGGPVNMAEFHLTYLEDEGLHRGTFGIQTVDVDYLAVVCRQCRPRTLNEYEYLVSCDDREKSEELEM